LEFQVHGSEFQFIIELNSELWNSVELWNFGTQELRNSDATFRISSANIH